MLREQTVHFGLCKVKNLFWETILGAAAELRLLQGNQINKHKKRNPYAVGSLRGKALTT